MRLTRHPYELPGWGVGEVWVRDGAIVQHVLASGAPRAEPGHGGPSLTGWGPGDVIPVAGTGPEVVAAPAPATPDGGARLPDRTVAPAPSQDRGDPVPDLCRRVAAHLAGIPTSYDGIPIDLEWATPLQCAFAAAARAIPWGEVVSYGELAALAGRPRAARAAGTFCAENRYALVIPCHRVVAANGIGGYGGAGVHVKRRLLALEGVHL